jgi:hypothetical protein
MVNMRNNQCNG